MRTFHHLQCMCMTYVAQIAERAARIPSREGGLPAGGNGLSLTQGLELEIG